MYKKTLALALAAAASAAPQYKPTPLSDKEFGLLMDISPLTPGQQSFVSLNAAKNSTDNDETYHLIGQRLSVYPGTPAFFNQVSPDPGFRSLEFDIDGVSYGLFAEDIGHRTGALTSITARKNVKQYEWQLDSQTGQIRHKLHAAINQFFACNNTVINGERYVSLAWGNYPAQPEKGGEFEGCFATSVYQNL